jgi:hypothetical protein
VGGNAQRRGVLSGGNEVETEGGEIMKGRTGREGDAKL